MKRTLKGGVKTMLIDSIRPLWGQMSYAEIAAQVGSTAEAVRKCGRRAGLAPYRITSQTVADSPDRDLTLNRYRRTKKVQDEKYKALLEALEVERKKLALYERLGSAGVKHIPISPNKKGKATAVIVMSDWHYGETVEKDSVNGLNEFNKEIAERRIKTAFANSKTLVEIFSARSDIDNIVIAFLGDLVNGNIHEEFLETNDALPIDQVLGAMELVAGGIDMLSKMGKKVTVLCMSGNHARITDYTRHATESGNSLEYLMYNILARKMGGAADFIVPRGYLEYLRLGEYTIRFHHGHALRYSGGIGGIFIPAYKAIGNWNVSTRADLDVFGHFHQFRDGSLFVSNGSLVGWNPFAVSLRCVYERPKQGFFLIDHLRNEKTVTCPVFVD